MTQELAASQQGLHSASCSNPDVRGFPFRIGVFCDAVGFDDRPESHWVTPRLTTVRQPLDEMAHAAVSLLVRLMRGESPQSRRIELATSLLERDSTAPFTA